MKIPSLLPQRLMERVSGENLAVLDHRVSDRVLLEGLICFSRERRDPNETGCFIEGCGPSDSSSFRTRTAAPSQSSMDICLSNFWEHLGSLNPYTCLWCNELCQAARHRGAGPDRVMDVLFLPPLLSWVQVF